MASTPSKTTKAKASPKTSSRADSPAVRPKEVDLSLDISSRPLAGMDIRSYMESHRLERVQVIEALAMASPAAYNKLANARAYELPMQIELLLRWYLKQPPQSQRLLPVEVFNRCYGDILEQFKGHPKEIRDTARIMLYERFSAMLGRTVYAAYRWFKKSDSNNFGVANGPLRRLFSVLPSDNMAMRLELESLARAAFRVRGMDLDAAYPLPSIDNPPEPRKPGPVKGSKAKRQEDAAEQVETLVAKSIKKSALTSSPA